MEIVCVSLNHRVTPLEVRERVAFQKDPGVDFLRAIRGGAMEEVALLSTCNRTEIYAWVGQGCHMECTQTLLQRLRAARSFEPHTQPPNYAVALGNHALGHLFRVASGMESQILGESQILAQVKEAHVWSQEAGTSGRVMQRLFERALRVGKRVRTETSLGSGAMSASYAALQLARKIFGRLEGRSVLIVGAGEIAELTLQNLQDVAIGDLVLMNRTRANAVELAERHGGRVRDLSDLAAALEEADVVVSSTAAPEPLMRLEDMKAIRQRRGGDRPLLIVDLAMPRDFEPSCGTLDQVFLKNLDDLQDIIVGNTAARARELPRAESIVAEECATFLDWLHSLEIEPTIRELRDRFEMVRMEEIENLRGMLDPEAFATVDQTTRRILNRILHQPSENLRRHEGLRNRDVKRLVHELLTQDVPHRKEDAE